MPNVLGIYDPVFYANEALIALEKNLGLAGRVYRGVDKSPQQRGSIISIRRPGVFTAENAPSTAQDIETGNVDVTLSNWKEVKFKLTDKELSFTGEDIIREHIRPATYALANKIDTDLASLYAFVPWYHDQAGAAIAWADITATRKVMRNNQVPLEDDQNMHFMLDGTAEAGVLSLAEWTRADASGTNESLMRGSLGRRLGMEFFANQNTPSHTPGVSADATGALAAAALAGATSITWDGVTAAGTYKAGDSFVITGDTQRYVLTEDATADGGGIVALTDIYPPLKADAAENAVITFSLDSHVANLAFHRNAFALAMAPLSEMGNNLGAQIATVTDEKSGISVRSRVYYVGNSSEVHVALDVLYGYRVLDGNLSVRLRS
jgi:hypothetical protein